MIVFERKKHLPIIEGLESTGQKDDFDIGHRDPNDCEILGYPLFLLLSWARIGGRGVSVGGHGDIEDGL
jgi:hypothetical protein